MRCLRCYTCGKILGNKWEVIDKLIESNVKLIDIYNIIGLKRYCCKKTVMTSVDTSYFENIPSGMCQEKNSYILHTENDDTILLKSE